MLEIRSLLITYKTKTKYNSTAEPTQITTKQTGKNFTQEIEQTLPNSETPQNAHTATKILTNAIVATDKHHIPK